MSDDSLKFLLHMGSSMNPALKPLDIVHAISYGNRRIRRGDVVVFVPPGADHKVTHRVISADSEGIRTRGDNSPHADPWVLSLDDIRGQVICAQRRNRRLRMYGGLAGRVFHLACRTIVRAKSARLMRMIRSVTFLVLRAGYHCLGKSGVLRKWLPAAMETRVISLERPAGTELQLVMGGRVIGRCRPGKDQWQIRRPFRLFVDEACLPGRGSGYRASPNMPRG